VRRVGRRRWTYKDAQRDYDETFVEEEAMTDEESLTTVARAML
jgi:hypothetical protein